MRWGLNLDASDGGRCYLSWHQALIAELKRTDRLAELGETPEVWFTQAGRYKYVEPPDGAAIVVQSVTAPSEALETRPVRASREAGAAADMVSAYSEVGRQSLIDVGVDADKIFVVRPGVSFTGVAAVPPPLVVGYAGQDLKRKRQWVAEAAAMAAGVRFLATNDTPHVEMPGWYRRIALLALPSMLESWGIVASEAVACGVPVVVTDGCGCSEEIAESGAGIVVPADSRAAFVDAVCEALEPERYAQLLAAVRRAKIRTQEDWASDLIAAVEGRL